MCCYFLFFIIPFFSIFCSSTFIVIYSHISYLASTSNCFPHVRIFLYFIFSSHFYLIYCFCVLSPFPWNPGPAECAQAVKNLWLQTFLFLIMCGSLSCFSIVVGSTIYQYMRVSCRFGCFLSCQETARVLDLQKTTKGNLQYYSRLPKDQRRQPIDLWWHPKYAVLAKCSMFHSYLYM